MSHVEEEERGRQTQTDRTEKDCGGGTADSINLQSVKDIQFTQRYAASMIDGPTKLKVIAKGQRRVNY